MKAIRNTNGLRENAQKKRQEAFDKVDKGIKELIRTKQRINFNTVAKAAGVSKAFLYKEPEVKARVEQLRQQYSGGKTTAPKHRASDASKDNIIKALKAKLKKSNERLKEQDNQIAIIYGQIAEVGSLREKLKRVEAENERLRYDLKLGDKKAIVHLPLTELEKEISGLGVKLNSTLSKLIHDAPPEVTRRAIDSLKEGMAGGRVQNPPGFLNKAIRDTWTPNEVYAEKVERDLFNEWYPKAHAAGIVRAATMIDDVQHVFSIEQEDWVAFKDISEQEPVETLPI